MNLYLITTSGSGEVNIDLVEEDIWDFIFKGRKSTHLASVKEKYLSYKDKSFVLTAADWNDVMNISDD